MGASISPHQTDGNNANSDWWAVEASIPCMRSSGAAVDSYNRYSEDTPLFAGAGLNAYRFGARLHPSSHSYDTPPTTALGETVAVRIVVENRGGRDDKQAVLASPRSPARWSA